MKKRLLALLMLFTLLCTPALAQREDSIGNWYEIFVYSYFDSDGDGIGDLNGVAQKLDYIEEMGYDGLWLMPVTRGASYHKYDVVDYCDIDPEYGTKEDMKALVKACHERDIKIIVDMPLNHTSTQNAWFLQACESIKKGDLDNPYISYYNFSKKSAQKYAALSGTDWYYEEQFTGGNMPDLNLDNESVWQEFRKIFEFWLTDCDVDGFRLDAVTSYYASDIKKNVQALNRIKALAEEIKPGRYLVGEAWTGLSSIASYYESDVDSFFLFPAAQAEGYIAGVIRARKPGTVLAKYLTQINDALGECLIAPFLSNHDTGRAIGSLQARSSLARAKFGEGLLGMMGGNSFTYYGDEIGMVGSGDDPNKRLPMYWNDSSMTACPPGVTQCEYVYPCVDEQLRDEDSLLSYCKALNHLRLSVPAISRGKTEITYSDDALCVIKRSWENEACFILLNCSATQSLTYTLPEASLCLAGSLDVSEKAAQVTLSDTDAVCVLPPYSIVVLTKK